MHCSNLLESFPGHLAVSSEIPALCRHHWTLALRPLHCDLGRILLPRSKLRHRHLLLQPRGSRHQNEAQPVRPVRPKNKVRISYEIYDCTKWWDLTGVLASLITVFISFSTLKNVQAILLIMNVYIYVIFSFLVFIWSFWLIKTFFIQRRIFTGPQEGSKESLYEEKDPQTQSPSETNPCQLVRIIRQLIELQSADRWVF